MLEGLKDSNPMLLILGVILIPISVAIVSLWADGRNAERQRELSQQIFTRQERLTVTQTIDNYFEGIGKLLATESDPAVRDRIVVARTRALLARLSKPEDNALVVRFISELRADLLVRPARIIERAKSPYISLAGIDLSGTNLSFVNLYNADLHGSKLRNADLSWANLSNADLSSADLSGATLNGSELGAAALGKADLTRANLRGTGLVDADLRGATLREAVVGGFEVEDISLHTDLTGADTQGATWLDGHVCTGADTECTP